MSILVTGGTGFLGKAILTRLVDMPRFERIYLLVRPKQAQSAEQRVTAIIGRMFPAHKAAALKARIHTLSGQLESPGLGLSPADMVIVRREVRQILHIGASTDFGAPLAESRLSNVEGTRHVLDLAVDLKVSGEFVRFDYVSTAYVAGRTPGIVTEGDLDRGQTFANNYEQSKFEAEVLVREHCRELPITIYRPSIIVGDSRHGFTPHFKVLYWPLLVLSKDLLRFFACNMNALLDVVPVDFVADSIVALMLRETSVGQTFHLTAGKGNEIKIRQLLTDAYSVAKIRRRPSVPFWAFYLVWKTWLRRLVAESFWEIVELARPYFCYLQGTGVRFDATATDETLGPLGIHAPLWENYKHAILNYCLTSRWGRKPSKPEFMYYLTGAQEDFA